jgi:thiol-disulfide isomerase/thioredoxin
MKALQNFSQRVGRVCNATIPPLPRKRVGGFNPLFLGPLLAFLLVIVSISESRAGVTDDFSRLPWPLLPKVSSLSNNQRTALFDELKNELGYGECKDTIIQCLERTKPDAISVRVMNFAAYLLSIGVPPIYLRPTVRERAKFFNAEQHRFSFEETPVMGNERAQITIVEFAEFKCPYCATMFPLLKRLVEESNGSVRVLFKHFPLKKHAGSVLASEAAQAAYRQGKFWEMYELLFKNMENQDMEHFLKWARELGLDMEKFKRDMDDPKLLQIIERDTMEGVKANLRATPTLFINGRLYHLRHDEYFLKDVIDEEAERINIKPPYEEWAYR